LSVGFLYHVVIVSAFRTNQLQGEFTGSAGAEVVERKKICWFLQNYVVETSNMFSEIKKVTDII